MTMRIISIDIGILNLGIVFATLCADRIHVSRAERHDITRHIHRRVHGLECKLHHTLHPVDYVSHLVQEYDDEFRQADTILLERQPPQGLKDVEALLYHYFRDKAVLIDPRSMHRHFGIGKLSYDQRKERNEHLASFWLDGQVGWDNQERKHDMADALCMILYYKQEIVPEDSVVAPRVGDRPPLDSFRF